MDSSSNIFLALLTVLFIGLKLTHVIAWSWVWVLAPLWVPVGLAIIILAVVALVAMAVSRN